MPDNLVWMIELDLCYGVFGHVEIDDSDDFIMLVVNDQSSWDAQ